MEKLKRERERERNGVVNRYLERTVRIKKGFLEITETKRERDGPSASKAYPIPAAIVIFSTILQAPASRFPLPSAHQQNTVLSFGGFTFRVIIIKILKTSKKQYWVCNISMSCVPVLRLFEFNYFFYIYLSELINFRAN